MKYPIFASKSSSAEIVIYFDESEIGKTTREIVKSGYFDDFVFYDKVGDQYKVIEIKELSKDGLIGGWHPFYKGTLIKIEFLVERTSSNNFALNQLKKKAIKNIKETDYSATVGIDFEKIINGIKTSNSYLEVINCFLYPFEKQGIPPRE